MKKNKAKKSNKSSVEVHLREGYDHSYFYISTFAGEHVRYHAKFLHA